MPKIGERLPFELTWREQLGMEGDMSTVWRWNIEGWGNRHMYQPPEPGEYLPLGLVHNYHEAHGALMEGLAAFLEYAEGPSVRIEVP